MNLFGGSKPSKPETPPSIDAARERVGSLKRTAGLRGRAAGLLTEGQGQVATAQRRVTGN